jgi:predicted Zn finger-like uncharacterized protein
MIIECTHCQKQYQLDDLEITPEGTTLTCVQCNTTFVVRSHDHAPDRTEKGEPPSLPAHDHGPEPGNGDEASPSRWAALPDGAFIEEDEVSFAYARAMGAEASLLPDDRSPHGCQSQSKTDQEGLPVTRSDLPPGSKVDHKEGEHEERTRAHTSPAERRRVWRRLFIALSACVVLFCAAAALMVGYRLVGGTFHFETGAAHVASWFNRLLGLEPSDKGSIQLSDLNGYFVTRGREARIFVIEGKATNRLKAPCSFLRVSGTLFDEKGEVTARETGYCGNILNVKELQSYSQKAILERLSNAYGTTLSNLNLEPDQSLPFMLVFFDPPANIAEYSVEVIDYKAARHRSP